MNALVPILLRAPERFSQKLGDRKIEVEEGLLSSSLIIRLPSKTPRWSIPARVYKDLCS